MPKEEKAKEYAKVTCLDIVRHYNVFTKEEISEFTTTDYLAGYTQAEQDLSTQLTAYKEALREIVERLNTVHDSLDNDSRNRKLEVELALAKAKTLIE